MPGDIKTRKRMVVEEVNTPVAAGTPVVEKSVEVPPAEVPAEEPKTELLQEEEKPIEEIAPVETVEKALPKPEPKPESKGVNPLVIIVPGILLLGALVGGIVFYQRGISPETTVPTPTPNYANTATSPTPTATTEATLNLTKYPINVMNGSGISGQAGVVKNLLTTAGFTVTGTGNAASYDFTKTVIKAKVDVPAAFLTQLSTTLGKSYVLDTNQSLATSSANEVQVIVGSTKAQ